MKIFIALFFAIFGTANAFDFDLFNRKLDSYSCPNANSARSCSGCKKEKYKVDFKIDVKKSIVIMRIYEGGALIRGDQLDGDCKVIDDKNWLCVIEDNQIIGQAYFQRSGRNGMNDGLYYQVYEGYITSMTNLKTKPDSSYFSCAK